MSANLLGALVLAATVAFVVGTVIERGSGESPASQRAESPSADGVERAAQTGAEAEEAHAQAGHGRSELRALGVDLEAAPFVALAAAAAVAGRLASPLSATRGPRAT
jgi:hypothetical protein